MISKVYKQQKIQKDYKFQDFNICPNILHVDEDMDAYADADTGAGGIAIALLHLSAGALKTCFTVHALNFIKHYLCK